MIVDEWVTGTIEKMRSVSEPELLTSKTASVVQQHSKKVPILTTQKVNQVSWIPKRACNQHNTTAALDFRDEEAADEEEENGWTKASTFHLIHISIYS